VIPRPVLIPVIQPRENVAMQTNWFLKSRCFIITGLLLAGFLTFSATAEAKNKGGKKAIKAAMLEKYDTNKDGKLSKKERAAMSPEDAAKFPKKKKNA
jgi:hypothetical protein